MATILFCKRVLDFLEPVKEIDILRKGEIAKGIIEMLGDFIYHLSVPGSWLLRDMERIDNHTLFFHWISKTDQALCPNCRTVTHDRVKTYLTRHIQDLPVSRMTVYHTIKANRYYCHNPDCESITFIEQFDEITDKDARLSNRLKDFVVRQAIDSSCIGSSRVLRGIGVKISKDTINREVKKKGALVVAQNLKRDDVNVLSVDDINLRKGNSSTACSVFIDAETHRVLVVVQGATGEIAKKVIELYPSATMVSRDRGAAYATAATQCGKEQVADGFHLVQNMHQTIKKALYEEITQDPLMREGDGWIRIVDRSDEQPVSESDPSIEDPDQVQIVLWPKTLAEKDIERRIHLAGLNKAQANKYKKTIAILELTESGLHTADIMKRLSLKKSDVWQYRKMAPQIIENVELKIDEYYKMHEQGQWEYHQKTIAAKAQRSSKSIVEPYRETVLSMFEAGKNHRDIHPVIVQEGFKGSPNTVYQYLIKHAHENNIPYGRHSRVIPPEERNSQSVVPRPPTISIERTSRHRLYQCLLHAAAKSKHAYKQALLGRAEDLSNPPIQDNPPNDNDSKINKTNFTDEIAQIIFDTKPKDKSVKKNGRRIQ
jgi:hypothetical protein